jgi:DNA polymerase-3 subunit beta
MFEFTISKQQLLTPLLTVAGAVDKKQSLPVLGNILLELNNNSLKLTATDLEIEITAIVPCSAAETQNFKTTVPAKKMIDIIRSFDDNATPNMVFKDGVVTLKEGRVKFKLATLPADNFPNSEEEANELELAIPRLELIRLLNSTHFAMSQQDARIFLNGLLLEFIGQTLTAVATDGHRMAICKHHLDTCEPPIQRLLLPRKSVQEILRLLNTVSDESIDIAVGKNHIRIKTSQYVFLSKLIEARFPPYAKVIPKDQNKSVSIQKDLLKRALSRIVILANEKSRAVVLHVEANQLTLIANNQEQEEAIETVEAKTEGEEIKIGINANYLLDVLNYIPEGLLTLELTTAETSISVSSPQDENYQYIIMPMKL